MTTKPPPNGREQAPDTDYQAVIPSSDSAVSRLRVALAEAAAEAESLRTALKQERLAADEKLRESRDFANVTLDSLAREKQFAEALFASLPAGACVFDENGRFVRWNDYYRKTLGWSDDDMRTIDARDTICPGDRKRVSRIIQDIFLKGQGSVELSVLTKDGREIPFLATCVRMEVAGRVYLVGIGIDISDRVWAQEALRESEERFRCLVESAPEAIFVQSQGRFVYINPAMLRLFGASRSEDLLGTEFMDRMAPEYRDVIRERIRVHRETGTPAPLMDQEYLRLDGSRVPVETTAVAIRFRGGDAHLVFVRDITERKRAEQERQRLEAQYRQAQKMEAVGRLAAGVAHDFNNQLTVIMGYSEMLLKKRREGDPAWDSLIQIRQAAQRAQSTTSHLLSFSRKQMLDAEVVDLCEFMKEAEKPISRMIGEDVKLIVVAVPDLPAVFIDKSGLHQVLMNLVVNARDAMPKGGQLVLRTAGFHLTSAEAAEFPEATPGDYVLLEVTDSGSGMDGQTLERVFDPFFTTKGPGKGTGLGLPMVIGFIRQSHGFVDIRSQPGKGTAVRLLLPTDQPKADANKRRRDSASVGKSPSKTLMVVEDEASVRSFVVNALEDAGYRVLAASGPKEALKLSEEHESPIDLLISDMIMPDMRGDELARRLKLSRRGLHVLFVTGYDGQGADLEGSLLRKPFKVDDLLARVRSLLIRRRPGRQRKPGD